MEPQYAKMEVTSEVVFAGPAHLSVLPSASSDIYHDVSGDNLSSSPFSSAHGMAPAGDVAWGTTNHYACYEGSFPSTLAQNGTPPLPPFPLAGTAFPEDYAMDYMRCPSTEGLSLAMDDRSYNGSSFGVASVAHPTPFMQYSFASGSRHCSSEYPKAAEHAPIPEGVKMPQRKGGMQLWQFLYALLSDQESQLHKLIEWTSNRKEREFRLLQPEAIAVWWGHHKNKENMSYDKLSRSLRYYYDKGLLKKIPGERYVYRFCIDPERMYKHIGNSESRPKLKPMPQAAKLAISTSTKMDGEQSTELATNAFIAQPPESLSMASGKLASMPNLVAPQVPHVHNPELLTQPGELSIRRCISLDIQYRSAEAWEPSRHPSVSTYSPVEPSVSLSDFQLVPDTSFSSPHSTPYGSPLPSSDGGSPPMATSYSAARVSEATSGFDLEYSGHSLSPPLSYATASYTQDSTFTSTSSTFYPPPEANMPMWTFVQE